MEENMIVEIERSTGPEIRLPRSGYQYRNHQVGISPAGVSFKAKEEI
jgi:hypothetical protein